MNAKLVMFALFGAATASGGGMKSCTLKSCKIVSQRKFFCREIIQKLLYYLGKSLTFCGYTQSAGKGNISYLITQMHYITILVITYYRIIIYII